MLLLQRLPGVRMIKPIHFPFLLPERAGNRLLRLVAEEGTVEPLPNGKRLPTDFNEARRTTPILVTRR